MTLTSTSNVIVVGAGVAGARLAFHLARDGARVTLIDKGDICAGMSSRSGALLRMHYTVAPEADLAWKSLRYFSNWRELVSGATASAAMAELILTGASKTADIGAFGFERIL